MNDFRPCIIAARRRSSARATALLTLAALTLAATPGCGPSRTEQCTSLVAAVERGDRARTAADFSSKEARKRYYDGMLEVKKELASLPISDDELVKLRDAATKNLETFIFSQRDIEDAQTPDDLERATRERDASVTAHAANAAALGTTCAVPVDLPSRRSAGSAKLAPTAAPSMAPAAPPASAGPGATPETWTTFRHPTLPFEAQFFAPPEVGERKSPNTITSSAIATDAHRMFSATHIEVLAPDVEDCKLIVETHLRGTQDRFACQRTQEVASDVKGAPHLEAVLKCSDGATILKRVGCDRDPATKRIVIFDVQTVYLSAWNDAEARRFAAGAKLTRP
jgi:hypothetical protein